MIDEQVIEDTFLELIEDAFDDLHCESIHSQSAPDCSVKAVAYKTSRHSGTFPICQKSLDWNLGYLAKPESICNKCKEHPSKCWTITPF